MIREVAVDGGSLHVAAAGEGPPALLLHGGPGGTDASLEPLSLLLAGDLTTHRYTQRGVAPAPAAGPLTVAQHVADAVAVLDALGLERPVVIGHSFGGFLALALTAAHPQGVRAVVSIDGLGVTGDGGWAEYDAGNSPALTPPGLHLDPGAHAATAADTKAVLAAGTLPPQLAGCRVPALFLPGELSPMPHWAAHQAAGLLANGRVVTIPGAAHFPFLENGPATRDAITAFLALS